MASDKLTSQIVEAANRLSPSAVGSVCDALGGLSPEMPRHGRVALLCEGAPVGAREEIEELTRVWDTNGADVSPVALALALRAASSMGDYCRSQESVELVWTGPDVSGMAFRRTDQALLELIECSQETLIVVTFAVYKIPEVAAALVTAARRGVSLTFILEYEESGKVDFDGFRALGSDLMSTAQFYMWPLENRPRNDSGRPGTMHVKCAIADQSVVLLSSANLTEFALNINMEMGVMIRGGTVPARVAGHFRELVRSGVLAALD